MPNILDEPVVRLALGLGVVVVIAGLGIFTSIKDNLIAGAQNSAELLPIVVAAGAWTGYRRLRG